MSSHLLFPEEYRPSFSPLVLTVVFVLVVGSVGKTGCEFWYLFDENKQEIGNWCFLQSKLLKKKKKKKKKLTIYRIYCTSFKVTAKV